MIRHTTIATIAAILLGMVLTLGTPLSSAGASSALASSAASGANQYSAAAGTGLDCVAGPVSVTWETSYTEGRYIVRTARLDGLQACAGGTVWATISDPEQPLLQTEASLDADVVVLDLRDHHIPAHSVTHLSLTVTVRGPDGAGPVQIAPEINSPEQQDSVVSVAAPTSDGQASMVRTPNLATTGIRALWVLLTAATFIGLGAVLRHRNRQGEQHV